MRALMALPALLIVVWSAWAALMVTGQRDMVFPGHGVRAPRTVLPPGAAEITIDTLQPPGRAILLRAAQGQPLPALIFAHGNAEFARQNTAAFAGWADAGAHVLLLEYPGYDGAPGAPSQAAIDALWLAAHDWLAMQPGVDPRRIIALGRSLGSGPSATLAARRPLAAVVLQSAFASTDRFARERLLPGFLVRDKWDNVAALAAYRGPVFASHGRRDVVIPPSHAQELGALPNMRMEWLDCGHNDCPFQAPEYQGRVFAFLSQAGVLDP